MAHVHRAAERDQGRAGHAVASNSGWRQCEVGVLTLRLLIDQWDAVCLAALPFIPEHRSSGSRPSGCGAGRIGVLSYGWLRSCWTQTFGSTYTP
jgi:hypothetical protein